MEETDEESRLLSILGVTAANPEDIERDVIAAAEERRKTKEHDRRKKEEQTKRRKKGLQKEILHEDEEEEIHGDGDEGEGEDHSQRAFLRNRLTALDQEIQAVESGLLSLQEEEEDDDDDDDDDDEDEEEEKKDEGKEGSDEQVEEKKLQIMKETTKGVDGLNLQRALGEERLESLKRKREKLWQRLGTLEADLLSHRDDYKSKSIADQHTGSVNKTGMHVEFSDHEKESALPLENADEFDIAIDSSSGFVETERDFLIRTGVVTPFDCLKGFERRVENSTINGSLQESSIANATASMAAIAKARPATKLVDSSELPKLAPPTREFRRIKKVQHYTGPEEKLAKSIKGQREKRKRPLPDLKWRKRMQTESDVQVDTEDDQREEVEVTEVELSEESKGPEKSEFQEETEMENDILLEGGLRIPSLIYEKLFDYQKTGVKWLWELHCQKSGGIIADEMGLGKTIQVAAFLASLHHSGLYKPSIVMCPVTLLRQWKRELRKWYDKFEVEILHDSAMSGLTNSKGKAKDKASSDDEGEDSSDDSECTPKKHTPLKHKNRWDSLIKRIVNHKSGLLITTYEQLRILREKLLDREWGYAVLDEGHRIRNPDAEVTLVCKQLQTVHRIIMTGAPIQNKLTELWSLFDFVFPGKLGVLPVFQAQFALPIGIGGYANATPLQVSTAYRCAVVLRDLIMPYLLRRLKSDVNANLTKKTEHVLFCSLTEEQRSAYRAFLASSEVEQIFDGNRNSLYGIDILRKLCNHADLLEREHSGNHPDYGNPERSGKLKVLAQVLDVWKTQGHRVLIFTQTQQMLDIIEKYVTNKGLTYRRMDGSTPIRQRMALIDEFNESSHVFVFILTTKVGGLGTNLIGANKVIIFDPDWNPSTDMQARERAWRIGQTRDVTVYRLITRGTIEEKVYHRQIYKHFLTNKILRDPKQRRIFKARDMRDLFTLNEETQESRTETSTLFSELDNVELITGKQKISKSTHNLKPEKGNTSVEDDGPQEDESKILRCLFEANGIHSALNHDVIESMNELEKVKVENESSKVAQRAAQAVLQSRMQRSGDSVAVPTWTGRSGAAGAPVALRRRFGSTLNSRILPSSTAEGSNSNQISPGAGSCSGSGGLGRAGAGIAGSSTGLMSSREVLARLRDRASVDMGLEMAQSYERPQQRDMEPVNLVRQLRMFIEQNGGSVSSTHIVSNFKDMIPTSRLPLFRQLLKEVAVLKKEGVEARWVLKDAYQQTNVET